MANEVGNSDLVTTWAFTGTKTEPDPSKFDQGWFLGERPPFEYMNWLQNDFGKKLNQLLTFGGAEWNATTEYPPGAMVTDGGSSWQSQTTNTNSPPTAVNVNWAIVLTSAVDSGALLAVNNLSDLDDAAIARSNLGLGGVAVLNNVPIANGGTGATTASGARSNLGLGSVATESVVPVTKGGTGSTTASTARTALGLGSASVEGFTDNDDLAIDPLNVPSRGNVAAAIAGSGNWNFTTTIVLAGGESAIDFSGIPSGVNELYLFVDNVDISVGYLRLQLGSLAGIQTTNYTHGSGAYFGNATAGGGISTTASGIIFRHYYTASNILSATYWSRHDPSINGWSGGGSFAASNGMGDVVGSVALSGDLEKVRFTTSTGGTFVAGGKITLGWR